MFKQHTILKPVSLKGVGIHTGQEVNLTFKPAKENQGYVFCRVDLPEKPLIEANINFVVNTDRGTNLDKNGIKIRTSEHVLAALVGMGIDNILIELDAPEPPIMDGSSKYFVEALKKAGDFEGLQKLPKNSSPVRAHNRCKLTGRPKGYMRQFGISRVLFREMANKGLIPGVRKASW